jgi:hypothetical protein
MRKLECFVIAPSNRPDGSAVWMVPDDRWGLVAYPSGCGDMPADAVKVNFDDVYQEVIQEAVERVNHQHQEKIHITCVRAQDLPETGDILVQLVRCICSADITITDLTAHNPNVFLEYGIRLSIKDALNIMICHEGVELPFDVERLRCIRYKLNDLRAARRATAEIANFIVQHYLKGQPGKTGAESGGFYKRNVELFTGRQLEYKLMEIFNKSPRLIADLAESLFTGEKVPTLKQEVFHFFESVGRTLARDPRGLQRAIRHYEVLGKIRGLSKDQLQKIYYELWKLCDTDPDLKERGTMYLEKYKVLEE